MLPHKSDVSDMDLLIYNSPHHHGVNLVFRPTWNFAQIVDASVYIVIKCRRYSPITEQCYTEQSRRFLGVTYSDSS